MGWVAKCLAATCAILLLWLVPSAAREALHPIPSTAAIVDLAKVPPGAQTVTVGVYPTVVDDLNIAASTYDVVAYVWFK